MKIPRSVINGYDDTIRTSVEAIQSELKASLSLIDYSAPVEQVRAEVVALMDAYCGAASDVGARLSSEFYNGLRQMVTGKDGVLSLQSGRNPQATERAVRAFIQKLIDADEDDPVGAFENLLLERVELEMKRAMAYNTIENARRDPDKPMVARVPQGEKTCDFCLMLASRGPVYLTEESAGAFVKYHAHCVAEDTPVIGNGLLACLRRDYEGPLVRIVTRNGRELSVTPNHPILTTRGWVSAGGLVDGDGLICARLRDGHVVGIPDVDDVPPMAKEVFESASFLNSARLDRMPAAAEYLDGKTVTNCDVEVVDEDGFQRRAFDASALEPTDHERFSVTWHEQAIPCPDLFGGSVVDKHADRRGTPTQCLVGGSCLLCSLGSAHLGCPHQPGCASIADGDASLFEPPNNDLSAHPVCAGDCKDAITTLVRFDNADWHGHSLSARLDAMALEYTKHGCLADAELARDLAGAYPGYIEVDHVALLDVCEVSCHVYDLSTLGGWYVASGVVTHNCDCKVVPFWYTVEDGPSRRKSLMSLEGYDPDALYDRYKHPEKYKDETKPKRSDSVVFSDKQFGSKAAKHCRDWGLDPSSSKGRDELRGIIVRIIDNADEVVVGTTWRGQPQPCTFYRFRDDVVIVNANGEYVTVMKDGASNKRFMRAREEDGNG